MVIAKLGMGQKGMAMKKSQEKRLPLLLLCFRKEGSVFLMVPASFFLSFPRY